MRRASIIVFSALVLLLTAGGARGQAEEEATTSPEPSRRRSAQILANAEQPEAEASWLSHHLERIHFNRKTGLAYTQPLRLAERNLEFSLRGPALGRKRVGLSFEITF